MKEYTGLKLLRKRRFNSKEEKTQHYSYLERNNVQELKRLLEEEYEDRFHVFKSWEQLLYTIAMIVLSFNVFFIGDFSSMMTVTGISLIFIVGARIFRRILLKNIRGYVLIESIVNSACRGEIDLNDY